MRKAASAHALSFECETPTAPSGRVAVDMTCGRQFQAPGPLELQEQSSADHIAHCAVGLLPPPRFGPAQP
jgi:hypothetical protein